MGFWKGVKHIVNKLPGGKYLTGAAADRQKSHYNVVLDKYNSYSSQAQSQIGALSQNLQQSMQNLRSLEEQKYYHGLQGQQLGSHASEYERALGNLERQKAGVAGEAQQLKASFEAFRNKAPALAAKISEVEKLPAIFQNLYETVAQQKERLTGLTEEEAASQIRKHKADIETLKKQREEAESKIRSGMEEITGEHRELGAEKAGLEQSLERYKYRQERLLQESSNFENQRSQLQKIIQDYKNEQDRINSEYTSQQSRAQQEEQQLQNYISGAQNQLDSLGREVEWRAGKYKKAAKNTGLVQGAALALATYGVGSGLSAGLEALKNTILPWSTTGQVLGSLSSGLSYAAPLLGIGHYLNTASKGQGLGGVEKIDLAANNNSAPDLSHLARYGLGSSKVALPELGGLKQSLLHFEMPTVPKLKDLPKLHEALGKIVSLKDIEGLGLGLPSMTSASGKKYSTEVLYNPDFIKKLKKVSRKLGAPYLKAPGNTAAGNVAYV